MGSQGEALAREMSKARAAGLPVVLVHENDGARDGCAFDTFFQTTPQDLINDGIYSQIANACHSGPHRSVSLALIAKACGARPVASRFARFTTRMLSVIKPPSAQSLAEDTALPSEQRMTFRVEAAGPVGLGLKDHVLVINGKVEVSSVVVSSVADGTPAAAQGVPVGSILRELNGESVVGLDRLGVIAKMGALGRPLEMVLSWSENANNVPDATSSGGETSRLAQQPEQMPEQQEAESDSVHSAQSWLSRQVSEAEEADKV